MTQLQLPQYGPITFNREIRGIRSNNGRFERYAERYDITFLITDDELVAEDGFRLRYEVFCDEMRVFDGDSVLLRETDSYDKDSLHALMYIDGELVAYSRLVIGARTRMNMEESVSLPQVYEATSSIELSRACAPKHWRRSEVVWVGFEEVMRFCASHNINSILSFSNAVMYNGHKAHGIHFRYEGKPIAIYGYKTYPLVIDVQQSACVSLV